MCADCSCDCNYFNVPLKDLPPEAIRHILEMVFPEVFPEVIDVAFAITQFVAFKMEIEG